MNKYLKNLLLLAIILISFASQAQTKDSLNIESDTYKVNVKLNGMALIGVANPAVEFKIDRKWSVQLEGLGVFAHSNFIGTGYPLQIGASFIESRYYFKKVFSGFFVAPNIGASVFRMNKNVLYKYFGWAPDLNYQKSDNSVQIGANLMGGLTLGYAFTFKNNPHWSIDVNWSLGRQWAYYEGYAFNENKEVIHYTPLNGSAEYMPFYRGGIYIAYKW